MDVSWAIKFASRFEVTLFYILLFIATKFIVRAYLCYNGSRRMDWTYSGIIFNFLRSCQVWSWIIKFLFIRDDHSPAILNCFIELLVQIIEELPADIHSIKEIGIAIINPFLSTTSSSSIKYSFAESFKLASQILIKSSEKLQPILLHYFADEFSYEKKDEAFFLFSKLAEHDTNCLMLCFSLLQIELHVCK